MRAKDVTGRWGEDLAAAHLQAEGLTLLDRNWRCEAGELDVVARDGATVVFCEVKTRTSDRFGDPAEAVQRQKASRLRVLATRWLADHPEHRAPALRFDVVAVVRPRRGPVTLRHLREAF